MNMDMDSKSQTNLELVNVAIHKLMDERKIREASGGGDDDDDHILLSQLLSQLELVKGENSSLDQQPKPSKVPQEDHIKEVKIKCKTTTNDQSKKSGSTESNNNNNNGDNVDKYDDERIIVKELKEIKGQNSVTHWLLSIMMVLTVAWQVSGVSLLLKVKNKVKYGMNHPFKLLEGMVTGINNEESTYSLMEAPSSVLPSLKIPDLPHLELPDLTSAITTSTSTTTNNNIHKQN
ncbi:uncharacterized protein LOC133822462 [Humulus lupulus]|uniref:uncharacterized protein LOC133822462 n=1 Tax=Humulus lupulus TaxID=3486 RepID=UPI002B4105C6|nr:uncharacterized protein LOC133822462 [Humulus lupulus]